MNPHEHRQRPVGSLIKVRGPHAQRETVLGCHEPARPRRDRPAGPHREPVEVLRMVELLRTNRRPRVGVPHATPRLDGMRRLPPQRSDRRRRERNPEEGDLPRPGPTYTPSTTPASSEAARRRLHLRLWHAHRNHREHHH